MVDSGNGTAVPVRSVLYWTFHVTVLLLNPRSAMPDRFSMFGNISLLGCTVAMWA